jgi:hypothetical protein
MNEARNRNRQVQITVLNPSLNNPLQGLSFEELLTRPRNLVIMANDYKAPVQDQASIGFAQELSSRYALQADVVHQAGRNIQMSRSINFFENTALGVPINPSAAGRPYPQFVNITRYESTGHSQYDALQLGVTGRAAPPDTSISRGATRCRGRRAAPMRTGSAQSTIRSMSRTSTPTRSRISVTVCP